MIRGYRNKRTGVLEYSVNRKWNPKLNDVNIKEKDGRMRFWVTFLNGMRFEYKWLYGCQIKLTDSDSYI